MNRPLGDKVHTEHLIEEVKHHPAIWDSSSEEYSNKHFRNIAWINVYKRFFPDYDDRIPSEQSEIATVLQSKWKSIRTCYSREINRRKSDKGDRKREYVHFERLRYLEGHVKGLYAEKEDSNASADVEEDTEHSVEAPKMPHAVSETASLKRGRSDDAELIEILKKRICQDKVEKKNVVEDEDRMFLLSLVSDLHKVPPNRKLRMKAEIIAAIVKARDGP